LLTAQLFQTLSNLFALASLLAIVFVPYHKALCVIASVVAIASV
jgi:hypothetical protein